jgi:hypothetical protein
MRVGYEWLPRWICACLATVTEGLLDLDSVLPRNPPHTGPQGGSAITSLGCEVMLIPGRQATPNVVLKGGNEVVVRK